MTDLHLRLATRAGVLASAQSAIAAQALKQAWPRLEIELVPIISEGDRCDGKLADAGGKELFVQALQQALLSDKADAACHSLKDVGRDNTMFELAAFLVRADPRDALIGATLTELLAKDAPTVATSSPRRAALFQLMMPTVNIEPIRGNVDTRLGKFDDGRADALILAAAGLERLHLAGRISEHLDLDEFVPAAGQGTIVLECLSANTQVKKLLATIDNPAARQVSLAERACVAKLDGDCHTPLGVHATLGANGQISLRCLMAYNRRKASGHAIDNDPIRAGVTAATALLADGGNELLAQIRAAGTT